MKEKIGPSAQEHNNRRHRTMASRTIEVTDLPKEENNGDVQNEGTIGFPTRRLGQVTL